MPTKPTKPTPAAAIKWTEEEWSRIATHLYAVKGPGLLSSENLEEIKARDVFDAQEAVLPAERHRKLVSVAQGFQAIRDRLRGIYRNKLQTQQEDLFRAKQRSMQEAASPLASPEQIDPVEDGDEGDAANEDDAAEIIEQMRNVSRQPAYDERDEKDEDLPDEGLPQSLSDERTVAQTPTQAERTADTPAKSPVAGNAPERSAATQPPHPDQARTDGVRPGQRAARPASLQAARTSQDAQKAQPAGAENFIELARPFVTMVCQEFARALVGVLSESGSEKPLRGLVQSVPGQSSAGAHNRPDDSDEGRPRGFHAPAGNDMPASASGQAVRQNRMEFGEDEGGYPAEVQPLFDPKLPPSPNSEFKPTIGLVGASDHDALALQDLYPQLQLVAVRADAIKRADVFQRCQRVIGLRDQIPPPTDDFLGRSLRHRYVRLSGGIERVREQLNTWLNKPGTLKSGPGPAPGQHRNAKGPGSGPKKRQFRRMG